VEPRRAHGHAPAAALRKDDGAHGRQGHLRSEAATAARRRKRLFSPRAFGAFGL
jgi:hypothetical protein